MAFEALRKRGVKSDLESVFLSPAKTQQLNGYQATLINPSKSSVYTLLLGVLMTTFTMQTYLPGIHQTFKQVSVHLFTFLSCFSFFLF